MNGNVGLALNGQSGSSFDYGQTIGANYGLNSASGWNMGENWSYGQGQSYGTSWGGSESQTAGESQSTGESESRTYGREASAQDMMNAYLANKEQEEFWEKQALYNAEEAEKNRQFQAEMSNTAYQRAVQDLLKAGLNPILAVGNMGASTPVGATASSGLASSHKANAHAESIGYSKSQSTSWNRGKSSSSQGSYNGSSSYNKSYGYNSGSSSSYGYNYGFNQGYNIGMSQTSNNVKDVATGAIGALENIADAYRGGDARAYQERQDASQSRRSQQARSNANEYTWNKYVENYYQNRAGGRP